MKLLPCKGAGGSSLRRAALADLSRNGHPMVVLHGRVLPLAMNLPAVGSDLAVREEKIQGTSSMSGFKPLQTICSAPKCRRRQNIQIENIWYVTVRHGAGTRRDAGWQCYACKTENTTPASHLPHGLLPKLPSRDQVIARQINKVEAARLGPAPAPAQGRGATSAVTVAPSTGPKNKGTIPSRAFPPSGPKSEQQRPRQQTAAPSWATGQRALTVLIEALTRINRDGGDALALGMTSGRYEPIEITTAPNTGASIADHAQRVLAELDEAAADVLVLGGMSNGIRWEVVLHYSAGAACFV